MPARSSAAIQLCVLVGDKSYDVSLVRRDTRHFRLRLDKKGNVHASVPWAATQQDIAKFVAQYAQWIDDQRAILAAKRPDEGTVMLEGKVRDLQYLDMATTNVHVTDDAIIIRGPINRGPQVLDKWWRERLLKLCNEYVNKWYPVVQQYGAMVRPEVFVRKMKRAWGTCTPLRKAIRFNYYLLCADLECIEYVVLHELTHLLYMDHGTRFKSFLTEHMPDWKERVNRLKTAQNYIGEF